MRFAYTAFSATVSRPIITVGVSYRRRRLPCDVLVDSGADINILNAELAEALGIDLARAVPAVIMGATGQPETVHVHPVSFTVGDITFKAPVAFRRMAPGRGYGIVGQQGFFDKFRITFDRPQEELRLTAV